MGEHLYKNLNNELTNVNPIVNYDDVFDNKGESLQDKFNHLNHIFLEYINNSVAATRLQIPIERRRKGLYITYIGKEDYPITESYIGENCDDASFVSNKNWSRLEGIKTDSSGKILSSYLPSYVDDVLEYDSLKDFPEKGDKGKIYVTADTDLTYRWSGSKYTEISKSLALGDTDTTAFPGNRGVKLEEDVNKIFNSIININNNIDNKVADINNKFEEIGSTINDLPKDILPVIILNPNNEEEIEQNKKEFSKVINKSLCWYLSNGEYHKGIIYKKDDKYEVVVDVAMDETKYLVDDVRYLDIYYGRVKFRTDGTCISSNITYNKGSFTDYYSLSRIFGNKGSVVFSYPRWNDAFIPSYTLYQDDFIYNADRWKAFYEVGYREPSGHLYEAAEMSRPQICSNDTSIGAIFPKKPDIEANDIVLFNITDEDRIHITLKKYIYGGDSSEVYKQYDLATKEDLENIEVNTNIDQELLPESTNAVSSKVVYDNYVQKKQQNNIITIPFDTSDTDTGKELSIILNGKEYLRFSEESFAFTQHKETKIKFSSANVFIRDGLGNSVNIFDAIDLYFRGDAMGGYLIYRTNRRTIGKEEYEKLKMLIEDMKIHSLDEE